MLRSSLVWAGNGWAPLDGKCRHKQLAQMAGAPLAPSLCVLISNARDARLALDSRATSDHQLHQITKPLAPRL